MLTLCIRYRLDPSKLDLFDAYAKALPPLVERCGGTFVAYYLPTKIAGSTEAAMGLIDFQDLAGYEAYRKKLESDPEVAAVTKRAAAAILVEDRSILRRASGGALSK